MDNIDHRELTEAIPKGERVTSGSMQQTYLNALYFDLSALFLATIVEDVLTGGIGIADDWASFVLARTMWRLASAM